MAEEFDPLADPLSGIESLSGPSGFDEVNDMAEIGQIVNDSMAVVASLEDRVSDDIASCLQNCHGDYMLCRACVEGDIARDVNAAGQNVLAVGNKVIKQITDVTGEAWLRAFELGIPPANSAQLAAAKAGEEIPDNPDFPQASTNGESTGENGSSNGDGSPNGNGTIVTNPVVVPVTPPTLSTRNLPIGPDGLECIPWQWANVAINNWAAQYLSGEDGSFVFRYPTEDDTGVWQTPTTVYSIPKKCPRENAQTIVTQPQPEPQPTPPTGTIVTVPTPPPSTTIIPGGTIITVPTPPPPPGSSCPPQQITVNVPPCPTPVTPVVPTQTGTQPTCPKPKCLICFSDGTSAIIEASDPRISSLPAGARILACGLDDTNLQQYAAMCGSAPPIVLPPEEPQPIILTAPSPKGGNVCSPETIPSAGGLAEDFLLNAQGSADSVADSVGAIVGSIIVGALGKLTGLDDIPIIGPALGSLAGAIGGSFSGSVIRNVVQPGGADPNCSSDAFFITAIGAATAKLFGNWFGTVPPQTSRRWQYILNYYCPNLIPTVAELNVMYARGYIPFNSWENATKFNGVCPDWNRVAVESIKTRLGIQDAYRLWKLGKIQPGEFVESWQRQGIDTSKELQRFQDAMIQYPSMQDIVRMMVRDVADTNAVKLLGLDDGFTEKWIDTPEVPLQTWGESQGINSDVAKAFWRAHWQAPSPTIIYEWLHRLRPDDRPDNDPNANLVFTKEQAAEALRIADYVPAFIDNYLAVSYRPLTRVDVRRMWTVGTFQTVDQVRQAYRDLGYNAKDAQAQADFTVKSSAAAKAKINGQLSATEVSNAYRDNLLREDEARTLLAKAGLTDEEINNTILAADTRRSTKSRSVTVKGLRQRYFMGEFTDQEAIDELKLEYMSQQQAEQTVHLWAAERRAKQKEPTVSMLCTWYGKGMLSLQDYLQRIRNLRYSEIDALRIVESCNMDVQKRRQDEIEKALKQQAKEQQTANRAAAALVREARAAARALKLQHRITHKEVIKRQGETITTTITDTTTDMPDINQTIISENVDVRTNGE